MTPEHRPASTPDRLTTEELRRWMRLALARLEAQASFINRLNVFPVPDKDTGNNMLYTLKEAVRRLDSPGSKTLAQAWRDVADGALVGARGNSGVILSQLFRGFAEAARGRDEWTAEDLCQGFRRAYEVAYHQVYHPVEGTVLTVARQMAQHARGQNLKEVLDQVVQAGRQAVQATQQQLGPLREAGVVDAGAQGFWLVVDAWRQAHGGDRMAPAAFGDEPGVFPPAAPSASAEDILFPYDTEALLCNWRPDLSPAEAAEQLAALGDSIVVAQAGDRVKIHVHTDRPQELFRRLFEYGQVVQMEMLDMREQVAAGGFAGDGGGRPADGAGKGLAVVAPPAYWPLFEGCALLSPDQGQDREGVLWVFPDRPLEYAFGVDSVAVGGQLVLEYDAERSWEENRQRFRTVLGTLTRVVIEREQGGYRYEGRLFSSPAAVYAAVAERLPLTGVVTGYLNQRAGHEEAMFWQTKLHGELVQAPAEGVWMEIVEQS